MAAPAMSVAELMENGMSFEQATAEMERRVFGDGIKRDARGRPIEQGIGSAANPTEHHFAALEKAEGKDAADRARAKAAKAAPR